MNKLDSMWYHEMPASGKLASSHIAVTFCALVQNDMIVEDLLEMEFEGIAKDFSDRKLSPMDYCIAYTDGEIFDDYIKPEFREVISSFFDSNQIFEVIRSLKGLEHDHEKAPYSLKCNWHNVDSLANWLKQQFS